MKVTLCIAVAAAALLAVPLLAQPGLKSPAAGAGPQATPALTVPPQAGELPPGLRVVYEKEEDGGVHARYVTEDGKVVTTVRGWSNRPMSPHGPIGVSPHDPEMMKLVESEHQAAKEAQALVNQLRSVADEKQKPAISDSLKAALTKQFDAQQKRRALEVSKIEERLNKLKDTMKKRDTAKEQIVQKRLDELSGVSDELGWEETGIGPRGQGPQPGAYGFPAPGYAPATTLPAPVPVAPRIAPPPVSPPQPN